MWNNSNILLAILAETSFLIVFEIVLAIVGVIVRANRLRKEPSETGSSVSFFYKFIPSWYGLRALAGSRIFRMSYIWMIIVPLIAKLFSQTEGTVNYLIKRLQDSDKHHDISLVLGLPFDWFVFYSGSLLYVAGNAIYAWKCPGLIKNYKHYAEFERKDKNAVAIVNIVENCLDRENLRKEYLEYLRKHYKQVTSDHSEEEVFRINLMMKTPVDDLPTLFALSTHFVDRQKILYRFLCAGSYLLALLLYGAVLAEQTAFVAKRFMIESKSRFVIRSADDVDRLFGAELRKQTSEHMRVISLNDACQVISIDELSVAALDPATVSPTEVFSSAIRVRAASIILLHNHTSGDQKPIPGDAQLTQYLTQIGTILRIPVRDHVIIGNSYVSTGQRAYDH